MAPSLPPLLVWKPARRAPGRTDAKRQDLLPAAIAEAPVLEPGQGQTAPQALVGEEEVGKRVHGSAEAGTGRVACCRKINSRGHEYLPMSKNVS